MMHSFLPDLSHPQPRLLCLIFLTVGRVFHEEIFDPPSIKDPLGPFQGRRLVAFNIHL